MRSTRLCYSILILFLLTSLSAQLLAQQPAATPDDDIVRITTNLVQFDFIVTDRRGNQITDLKAEDIEVFQDGKPQAITNFNYISTVPEPEAGKESSADMSTSPQPGNAKRHNVRRIIALVVDDLGMSFDTVVPTRKALRTFVEQQMRPGDLVALLRTGGEVGALQQFTTDKRQLLASIQRLRWNFCSRRGIHSTQPFTQDVQSLRLQSPLVPPPATSNPCAQNLDVSIQSLRFIISGMRDLPGRKSMIVLTDSLPISETDPFMNATGDRSVVGPLQRVAELAVRSSVVIYGVDTRGLPTLNISAIDNATGISSSQVEDLLDSRSADIIAGRAGTETLAEETGGFVVKNTNDLAFGLQRIVNDLRGYYLVGYRPGTDTFNRKFHKVSAHVRNRPDLIVRTRTGFFGISEQEERPKSTVVDRFLLALTSPFSAGDIDLQFTPLFTNLPATGSLLRTMLHIDARPLTFKSSADGWQTADLIVRGVLFGDNGKIVDEHRRSFTVRVRGETFKRIQSSGLDYVFNMSVKKPGAYQFRIAVLDPASTQLGSAGQFVEVPDIKNGRLALSGLVIRGLSAANTLGVGHLAIAETRDNAPQPAESAASPGQRRFQQGMFLDYSYMVFNGTAAKSNSELQLKERIQLFHDGKPFFDQENPVNNVGRVDSARVLAAARMRLGPQFPPGEYVLQVTVTDLRAPKDRQTATQWLDFEIVE